MPRVRPVLAALVLAAFATPLAGQAGPWKSLLDSSSVGQWKGYRTDAVPAGWSAAGGVLSKDGHVGDIVTREQFGDFELSLEWKIGRGGNSGVMYRVTEQDEHPYETGPEYQLLDDDVHSDGKNPRWRAAAVYDLYPRAAGVLKPVGEWNETRIIVKGTHVEHWLNGEKAVAYELLGAEWTAKVAGSKWKTHANYGKAPRGHIALQGDHTGALAFRNVKIRELK
jgi:hypothetical protein